MVVTGLGVATPVGIGVELFWDALIRRRCGVRPIETFDSSTFASRVAGALPPFSLQDYIPKTYRKSAKVMARDIKIAVACAYLAVTDGGLVTRCIVDRDEAAGPPNLDSTRFGANIGAGLVAADLEELASALSTAADDDGRFSLARWGAEGISNLTPLWLLKYLPNMLACHVTIVHDARAPSNTITCTEASSHLAIGEAFRTIARGDADVCICGGAESKVNPMAVARPQLWGRLNGDSNDRPERASRPFGRDRRGMVIAEGGGLVILETLEHARARGARIYAELVGFGAGANTHSWRKPDPDGEGIALALRRALADAGADVADVDLANPLGIGTVDDDTAEMAAWAGVLGSRLNEIPSLTTRGALGNNGAGSGAIDFAAAALAVHHNTVPASVNTDDLDQDCGFRFVQGDPIDARVDLAVSVGYAVTGGQCAALVIKRLKD